MLAMIRDFALLCVLTAGCSGKPDPGPPEVAAPPPAPRQLHAVLVAGDASLPVFDNAVTGVAAWLTGPAGVLPGYITRLSAARTVIAHGDAVPATGRQVLDAVGALPSGERTACFVFVTSHGIHGLGIALSRGNAVLTPVALDAALSRGCADTPTVVIVSGCYSGDFAAPPMARDNRIVLTAARADRPSFGCGAGRTYTVFDQCLLDSLPGGGTWRALFDRVRACVSAEEDAEDFDPSEPQGFFGAAVGDMAVP